MANVQEIETKEMTADGVAREWLGRFGQALADGAEADVRRMLVDDGTWRDLLGLSWTLRNVQDPDAIATDLVSRWRSFGAGGLALDEGFPPAIQELDGDRYLVCFFRFETTSGSARGCARLVSTAEHPDWRAVYLLTQLESLRDFPELTGDHRPIGRANGVWIDRPGWLDERSREAEFAGGDPQVVIVGGGHNGLGLAARLGRLGVQTLVIERNERVGDNWRNRYSSLSLHDPVGANHMPYWPYPPSWQRFIPKDKLANFLEFYAEAMELNVWTGATVLSTSHDAAEERWTVEIRRGDRTTRTLRPRHLVMATGMMGAPNRPAIPGEDEFRGQVMHSGMFRDAEAWRGRPVLVVGAGVSGHDVAQDLAEHGAHVTLLQRSSTYVVNQETFHMFCLSVYLESGPATEYADMLGNLIPFDRVVGVLKPYTPVAAEMDRELLDALQARGFQLQWGPEGQGVYDNHFAGRDGYYINVGASDLIISGQIGLKQGTEVDRLSEHEVIFKDGTSLPAELVVLATGYGSLLDNCRAMLGPAADRLKQVYLLAEDGEMSEVWRRSRHEGLWFMTGNFAMSRYYSKFVALQIKAIEEGVVPYAVTDYEATVLS